MIRSGASSKMPEIARATSAVLLAELPKGLAKPFVTGLASSVPIKLLITGAPKIENLVRVRIFN
jgi:hypothetical protein